MNTFNITFLVLLINSLCGLSCGKSKKDYAHRPKEERESFAIHTAITLYNITKNFDETLTSVFKHDHYEEIVLQDGVQLKNEMDGLEEGLSKIIDTIEVAGGVVPKTDNITTEIEELTQKVELGYDRMVKNTKSFVDKLFAAFETVKKEKDRLFAYLDETTRLKEQYEKSRTVLEADNIFLRNPRLSGEIITHFDINVLQTLLNYYVEMDDIENQILPILGQYQGLENMDPLTEEFDLVQKSIPKVKEIAEEKIRKTVRKYDQMLRHFEGFINAGIEKAHEVVLESSDHYVKMQERIQILTSEYMDQDKRIRALSKKFNDFLIKANMQAVLQAMKKYGDRGHVDRDEL